MLGRERPKKRTRKGLRDAGGAEGRRRRRRVKVRGGERERERRLEGGEGRQKEPDEPAELIMESSF